ncbi:Peptide chain release factor eRF1/aRF1 [Orpheovirus IHUMI-LCC2]|uniref:Peptide chain release factor eRF1/aRF1 n=1 Tax=Orpheovirus IHUMI-LCC2 TaxID=2023057 RepID=A0A2I2L4D0_9VIRU|nr:Peptide chain release factor eRF1/aRF1 [Orpheovirus IHUMI-LCC2]SNW62388.1 Peptide chain release factor eRF1/aRF1 [Orpheovirus IHUMI-LCC2]
MISGEETHLYDYNGQRYNLINKFSIHRQKGHKKGGQSSHRFMMIHDEQINQYVKEICCMMNKNWYDGEKGKCQVKGIIIGGIGDIRTRICKCEHLNDVLKKIIIQEVSISEFNIKQLTDKAYNIINCDKVEKERIILEEVFNSVTLGDAKFVYGLKEIKKLLDEGEVSELYVHQDSLERDGKIKILIEKGMEHGCTICNVSIRDEIGEMFRVGYGGIIAKLWYAIDVDISLTM